MNTLPKRILIITALLLFLGGSFWAATVYLRPGDLVHLPFETFNRYYTSTDGSIQIIHFEISPHQTMYIYQKAGLFTKKRPNIPQIKVSAIIKNISDERRFISFQGVLKRRSISNFQNRDQDDFALDPGEKKNLTLDLFLKTPNFYELTLQAGHYKDEAAMKSAAAPTMVWEHSILIDSEQEDIAFQP
ncbi:hypothetical protein K8I31_20820 [bacterium]|nr:hypothetical protein [bacterium]